jgi:hypothetical protein
MSVQSPKNDNNIFYLTPWEVNRSVAIRDFIVKRVGVIALAIINFAALGVSLYYISAYIPLPAQALLISPFIVGALAGLSSLKFPTLGVTERNYSNFINPLSLAGRALSYLFFGPLVYAINRIDWDCYFDEDRACEISNHLEKLPFEQIAKRYGPHFDNLVKYGFIHRDYYPSLKSLYKEYQPVKEALEFYRKGTENHLKAQQKLEEIELEWQNWKENYRYVFPYPTTPNYDFSKLSTKVYLKFRSLCYFRPPIAVISSLHV